MSVVQHLYKHYIRGSRKKAFVPLVVVSLCHLSIPVTKGINISYKKVYLSTRVLKHGYDKRPAEEFDFMMKNLFDIVKYPHKIYKNKDGKRGSFCFVREIENSQCLVSLETIQENAQPIHCEVATFFRTNTHYLNSYELLWEWKGGIPSS